MKFSLQIAILFLALLTSLSACNGKRKTLVELGNEQQILHVGNGDEISSVDPHSTSGMPEYHVILSLYEGLVSKNTKTLAIEPGVAERWEISDDGLIYTFHLRDDAKWSNGDKVVANDFVQTWLRGLMPALANEYASSMFVVKNGQNIYEGKADPKDFGAVALDDRTLQVTLNAPTPYFLQLLDHHSAYPVHIPTIKKFGKIDERGTRWTRPENFVGNGAFVLGEWTPNKYLSVKKSPTYWNAKNVRLNEVRYYPIQKYTTEERMFRSGQLHATYYLPREKLAVYKNAHDPALRSYPNFATYFYRFNVTKKPLDDVRVRKALAYSIDRKRIVEFVTKFGQIPAYTLTPPDENGYVAKAKMPYDVALAKKLLAEAGFPNGVGFPRLTITFNSTDEHQHIAEAVQQMWKDNLGVDIALEATEWKVFLDKEKQLDYQIDRASWIGDYLDPNTFLEMFVTNNGNNRTGFSDPRYDALIAKAALESNQEIRFGYFQEAEKILMDAAPILPFYTYNWNRLITSSVKGWDDNIMDYYPFKNMYLEH
ncbi:MAG: peptide ABC transporter substrate-binding protein [Gammaproteobacteria bacterium]|nr:MAG: peptide ABC transporter substrate-binding protein [Gammaproteobacteria bacterium]